MVSHLRVRIYFPGLANSPVRENKNVTFSLLTCSACMRSLTSFTARVLVALESHTSILGSVAAFLELLLSLSPLLAILAWGASVT